MNTITIYGASDDLIEVEGDIENEFYLKDDDEGDLLAFSDGTILRVHYDADGCWRVTPHTRGTADLTKEEAEGADSDNYSDRVTLVGYITWVVHGVGVAV